MIAPFGPYNPFRKMLRYQQQETKRAAHAARATHPRAVPSQPKKETRMNPIRRAWCRTFQAAFRIALPLRPYREP